MYMNCSNKEPQMVAFAIGHNADTYRNIKETKQFIIGIPKEDMLDKLYKAGGNFDKDIDEFEVTGLTPYDSPNNLCKRIKECSVNIDCVYENEIETGNHYLIVGKIVGWDIDKNLYADDKAELRKKASRILWWTPKTRPVKKSKKHGKMSNEKTTDIYSYI